MRIKSQFTVLIIFIILFPIISIIFVPLYHFFTSPRYHMFAGYNQIRSLAKMDLSPKEWQVLKEHVSRIPPNVDVAFFYGDQVVLSSMPELISGTAPGADEIGRLIKRTSSTYEYMFLSPSLKSYHEKSHKPVIENDPFTILTRTKVSEKKEPYSFYHVFIAFSVVVFIESIGITIVISLSRGLTNSLVVLDRSMKKIALGDLDTPIKTSDFFIPSEEFLSLLKSMDSVRSSLKDDQQRRTKFIMGISHDLRTPIAVIKGYSEGILDGVVKGDENIRNSLSIIQLKAEQLEDMINDLIDYEKLSSLDWRMDLKKIKLVPVLREFGNYMLSSGNVYKRNVVVDIHVDENFEVAMDMKLVFRALENLFSNALRYTSEGDDISLIALQSPSSVEIKLIDTGSGISEKDLERIWDIFFRGTNSRREAGSGIGLAIVKNIIETHGWIIRVESVEERGSTFTISIPLGLHENKDYKGVWSNQFFLPDAE